MAIGNNNGGGVEYEVEPSSGPQGNATAPMFLSLASTAGGGIALLWGCCLDGGELARWLGFLLLGVAIIAQIVAIKRLKDDRTGGGTLSAGRGKAQAKSASAARSAGSTYGGSGKKRLADGPMRNAAAMDAHVFSGNGEVVVFCQKLDDGSYVEVGRSVPVYDPNADVILESGAGGHWVKTVQKTP